MIRNILLLPSLLLTIYANAQNNEEPQIIEMYFVNSAGEKIEGSVNVDEKVVYLVIKTTNAIGEKIVLSLDEDEEYFYKKKFLAGGSSIKIPIKKDIEKVELTIFNSSIKRHVKRRTKTEGIAKVEDAKE